MSTNGEVVDPEHVFVLVTGANSGVGLGICQRLIDEFIRIKPLTAHLTLIFTTRSDQKSEDTLELLRRNLKGYGESFVAQRFVKRIHFYPEQVDLTDLLSIRALCARLLHSKLPRLNAIILNAGIGGWTGINWPQAVWKVLTNPIQEVTSPSYRIASVGALTKAQAGGKSKSGTADDCVLGEVFCANVFGHYMLAHGLMPLLRAASLDRPARIVWLSSVSLAEHHFNPDDLQGLESKAGYEHSKRLTDLLALTAGGQPATAKSVDSFVTPDRRRDGDQPRATSSKPTMHVAQPGVCSTSILPINIIAWLFALLSFYIARWMGSPWHTISAYSGAIAPTWLAVADEEELTSKGRNCKWGSSTDRMGNETVEKTDVPGWGLHGTGEPFVWWHPGRFGISGRMPGVRDATKEDVEMFIDQGAKAWRAMEELRLEWTSRLDEYDAGRPEAESGGRR